MRNRKLRLAGPKFPRTFADELVASFSSRFSARKLTLTKLECVRAEILGTFENVIAKSGVSFDVNCGAAAARDSADGVGLLYVAVRSERRIPNFIRGFGNESGTRNRGLSRVNAARIPIDLIHPGVMMASEHKLHLV